MLKKRSVLLLTLLYCAAVLWARGADAQQCTATCYHPRTDINFCNFQVVGPTLDSLVQQCTTRCNGGNVIGVQGCGAGEHPENIKPMHVYNTAPTSP